MMRRLVISRTAALALMLAPALAFAAPTAGTDQHSKHCASCDCMQKAPPVATPGAGGSTTSSEELQHIWTQP